MTGELELQPDNSIGSQFNPLLSPDKKYRLQIGEDRFTITDIATGRMREFVFHEDDRRFFGNDAIAWGSPRYLRFDGQRLALIDVDTMKMSFPTSLDGKDVGSHSYKFSPDLRWVIYWGEEANREGTFLAPVETPPGP